MTQPDGTWRIWKDPSVAGRFVDGRRAAIPGSSEQLDTLLRLVERVDARHKRVLDIGCGDGLLLETVMRATPVERGVALDGSPAMLEKAQVRFELLGLFSHLVEYIEADFNDPEWTQTLPIPAFDVVVSGFAIHHSEDERKRQLYQEIWSLLEPGGVFVNIEHVASRTPFGEELFEANYAMHLAAHRRKRGDDVDDAAVLHEIQARVDKSANRLAPIDTQLGWMDQAGFQDVDCYWKHYELAVLAGYRPAS